MSADRVPLVSIEGLCKSLGGRSVLRGLSLHIGTGEAVGLLGRNGAGKTTTIRCLLGALRPDGGRVRWHLGAGDPRLRIGYAAQESALYNLMTGRENLTFVARMHGVRDVARRVAEIIEAFDLRSIADRRAARLSGGQRRRLHLALAFVARPQLVILDEPTASIDVQMRREMLELLVRARDAGTAMLITTHDMEEAQTLLDRVVLLSDGRVVADGSPVALVEQYGSAAARWRVSGPQTEPPTGTVVLPDGRYETSGAGPGALVSRVVNWLRAHPELEIQELQLAQAGLDSVFATLTRDGANPSDDRGRVEQGAGSGHVGA